MHGNCSHWHNLFCTWACACCTIETTTQTGDCTQPHCCTGYNYNAACTTMHRACTTMHCGCCSEPQVAQRDAPVRHTALTTLACAELPHAALVSSRKRPCAAAPVCSCPQCRAHSCSRSSAANDSGAAESGNRQQREQRHALAARWLICNLDCNPLSALYTLCSGRLQIPHMLAYKMA